MTKEEETDRPCDDNNDIDIIANDDGPVGGQSTRPPGRMGTGEVPSSATGSSTSTGLKIRQPSHNPNAYGAVHVRNGDSAPLTKKGLGENGRSSTTSSGTASNDTHYPRASSSLKPGLRRYSQDSSTQVLAVSVPANSSKNGLRRNSAMSIAGSAYGQSISSPSSTATVATKMVRASQTIHIPPSDSMHRTQEPDAGLALHHGTPNAQGSTQTRSPTMRQGVDRGEGEEPEEEEIVVDQNLLEEGITTVPDLLAAQQQPHAGSSLAVATLLTEGDGPATTDSLQLARPVDPRKHNHRRSTRMLLGGILLLVVIVVVAVMSATNRQQDPATGYDDNGNTTSSPTSNPTVSRTEAILQLFPQATQNAMLRKDTESPQYQAFQWLLQDALLLEKYTKAQIIQRAVLVMLYYSTEGPTRWFDTGNTTTGPHANAWLDYTVSECDWYFRNYIYLGSTKRNISEHCDDQGSLKHLWLPSNGLKGTLPNEICLLESLETIALYSNLLTGTIPSCVGTSFPQLTHLLLMGNKLEGKLPTNFKGGLSQSLTAMSIFNNHLSDSLPTQLGELSQLELLWADQNNFTGRLPTSIGSMVNLSTVNLQDNTELTGTLPTEIGALSNLQFLRISGTGLSGSLPSEVGLLQAAFYLILFNNGLTGTLPTELGQLQDNLYHFDVKGNDMTSTLPTELGLCRALDSIFLMDNHFTSTLPSELGLMPNLRRFGASRNSLTGSIATEIGTATLLEGLWLENNQLVSSLPTHLGSLARLRDLSVCDNQITGRIPTQLGLLTDLMDVRLANNNINGSIPEELGELLTAFGNLTHLDVSGNLGLSGTVPSGLCVLESNMTREEEEADTFLSFNCTTSLCGCQSCGCI